MCCKDVSHQHHDKGYLPGEREVNIYSGLVGNPSDHTATKPGASSKLWWLALPLLLLLLLLSCNLWVEILEPYAARISSG